MKKLSIITINYNNREGLRKTIESVVAQTTRDFEYIVIDGGSTDGSCDIINQYKQFLFYSISEPDGGIYNAMNKGIDKATGDYCLFLNSGDCLYNSDVVRYIYRETKDLSCTFIFGKINIIGRNGKCVLSKPIPNRVTGYYIFKESFPHQGTLTKTTVLKKYHYKENYKIVSDWLFVVEMIMRYKATIGNINTICSNYMLDGVSSIQYKLVAAERLQGFKDVFGDVVLNDYKRLCYGETSLEILVHKVERFSFINMLMTIWNLPIAALYKLRSLVFRHFHI